MSYEASFYGQLISDSVLADSSYFEMFDIYIKQKNKRLKEDSFAASKLYTNMEILKAAGGFAFHTSSPLVRDFFLKDGSARNKTFRINIDAFIGNYELKVRCYDCELVNSLFAATVLGTYQIHDIKFKEAEIKQVNDLPAPRNRKQRFTIMPVISPLDNSDY